MYDPRTNPRQDLLDTAADMRLRASELPDDEIQVMTSTELARELSRLRDYLLNRAFRVELAAGRIAHTDDPGIAA